jgi:hypothetical protein
VADLYEDLVPPVKGNLSRGPLPSCCDTIPHGEEPLTPAARLDYDSLIGDDALLTKAMYSTITRTMA